jgi:adenylosuccinate synthase
MQTGKFNVILDQAFGSSGKGKVSTWLADHFNITYTSSANAPNAGHTALFEDGTKFVAKAIPTAAILKKIKGFGIQCFLSPGSGFSIPQLVKEWKESGKPVIYIHDRANIITADHKKRESEGAESTKHIASTMQGSAAAIVDKVLRKANCVLAKTGIPQFIEANPDLYELNEFIECVKVLPAQEFRNLTYSVIDNGNIWLHEGSQGYALSIDHGFQYPFCTSRNCTVQAAMDYMAIPPAMVGDVYLNLRTYPIRVGNVVEDGEQTGYSGDFYPDSKEITWEDVAHRAGMPVSEAVILAERERTTVTKRIRRVSTFSYIGLQDAIRVNGATKLTLNFIQYINWNDNGLKGGKEAFEKLSKESRTFIDNIEKAANIPVVLVGTGANHNDIINLL